MNLGHNLDEFKNDLNTLYEIIIQRIINDSDNLSSKDKYFRFTKVVKGIANSEEQFKFIDSIYKKLCKLKYKYSKAEKIKSLDEKQKLELKDEILIESEMELKKIMNILEDILIYEGGIGYAYQSLSCDTPDVYLDNLIFTFETARNFFRLKNNDDINAIIKKYRDARNKLQ